MCFIDYDRQMALVAEHRNPDTGSRDIVGISRLVKSHISNDGEAAVIVSDHFQHRGLGTALVRQLVDFGRDEKLERITATVLFENRPMQKIFQRLGFQLHNAPDNESLEAELAL